MTEIAKIMLSELRRLETSLSAYVASGMGNETESSLFAGRANDKANALVHEQKLRGFAGLFRDRKFHRTMAAQYRASSQKIDEIITELQAARQTIKKYEAQQHVAAQ